MSINSAHDYKLESAGNFDGIDITRLAECRCRGYTFSDATRRDATRHDTPVIRRIGGLSLRSLPRVACFSYDRQIPDVEFARATARAPARRSLSSFASSKGLFVFEKKFLNWCTLVQ